MKRPLAWPALLFIAGIVLGRFAAASFTVFVSIAFVLAVAALAWSWGRPVLLGLSIVAAGAAAFAHQTSVIGPRDLRRVLGTEPRIITIRGELREWPYQRYYDDRGGSITSLEGRAPRAHRTRSLTRITARQFRFSETEEWRPAVGDVAVVSEGRAVEHLWRGQQVEVMGVIAPPESALAPGLFDYRAHLSLLQIHYRLRVSSADEWKVLGATRPPLGVRFHHWAKRALARGLPENDEALQLLWAMTLGWKTALNGEVSEPFMRSGTLHVFAISGLHVMMIAAIIGGVLRCCRIPPPICGVIVITAIWFYTYATGWQVSAVRSSVMTTVFIGSWILIRPPNVDNSLAAAALIILLADPQQLFQAGFQLSFAVVFGLVLFGDFARGADRKIAAGDPLLPWRVRPWWQRAAIRSAAFILRPAITSFAATLASLPLIAHYFHLITPASLLSNILVVPMSGAALASNLASLLFATWVPWLTEVFNHSAWAWMKAMVWVSEWTARWPGAAIHVRGFGTAGIALYYLAFVALCARWFTFPSSTRNPPIPPAWRGPLGGTLALLALLTAIHLAKRASSTTMTVLPLSGGHAVFTDAPGRERDVLIDWGNESSSKLIVKPFLQSRGVMTLPNVILTHGDVDHAGGATPVADYFGIERVVTPTVPFRSPVYKRAIAALGERSIPILQLAAGERISDWIVLHPASDDRFSRADDNALVLAGTIHGTHVLLLGDLGPDGQKSLLERNADLRSDIVVASIPNPGEPLLDPLLERIQPRVIVIVDANFPATARARPPLRARLARANATVLYTSEAGAITVDFDTAPARVIPTRAAKVSAPEPAAPPQSSFAE